MERILRGAAAEFRRAGIELSEARGFAIAKRPLPVAAFNSNDSVRGRIFTLLHEFAHILLGTSTLHSKPPFESEDGPERWCNHVAAAILIPRDDLLELQQVRSRGKLAIWSSSDIEGLANRYHISPSAVIRRLDTFNRIASSSFATLSEEFDSRRSKGTAEKSGEGGGNFYNNMLTQLGSLLPSLAFRGFYADAITAGDLSSIMGTKVQNLGNFEEKIMGSRHAFIDA